MNSVQAKSERRSQKSSTLERHRELAVRLVETAETVIAASGLPELRARDLARASGCSVGAIYSVFPTLDALIMAVNDRTLSALQHAIEAETWPPRPEDQLAGFAASYLDFAARHRNRWAALFQHRLPPGQTVSAEYEARQALVFARVAEPISSLCPGLSEVELSLLTQTLFSAVHGIVALGLEQKLGTAPMPVLHSQLRGMVEAIARGLKSRRRSR